MLLATALRGSDVSAVVDVLDSLDPAPSEEAGCLDTVAGGVDRLIPADSVWWASCDYDRRRNDMASSDKRIGRAYEVENRTQAATWPHALSKERSRGSG